mmetsp:Transcript_10388/g.30707  ORF Transcript_10388/g.30707 Transcript_10388/m.30707 type:complete len:493 (-) Transcript_10388:99-1577(-)
MRERHAWSRGAQPRTNRPRCPQSSAEWTAASRDRSHERGQHGTAGSTPRACASVDSLPASRGCRLVVVVFAPSLLGIEKLVRCRRRLVVKNAGWTTTEEGGTAGPRIPSRQDRRHGRLRGCGQVGRQVRCRRRRRTVRAAVAAATVDFAIAPKGGAGHSGVHLPVLGLIIHDDAHEGELVLELIGGRVVARHPGSPPVREHLVDERLVHLHPNRVVNSSVAAARRAQQPLGGADAPRLFIVVHSHAHRVELVSDQIRRRVVAGAFGIKALLQKFVDHIHVDGYLVSRISGEHSHVVVADGGGVFTGPLLPARLLHVCRDRFALDVPLLVSVVDVDVHRVEDDLDLVARCVVAIPPVGVALLKQVPDIRLVHLRPPAVGAAVRGALGEVCAVPGLAVAVRDGGTGRAAIGRRAEVSRRPRALVVPILAALLVPRRGPAGRKRVRRRSARRGIGRRRCRPVVGRRARRLIVKVLAPLLVPSRSPASRKRIQSAR